MGPFRAVSCGFVDRVCFSAARRLGCCDIEFGLITFDDDGRLLVSNVLPRTELRTLGLHRELSLSRVEPAHLPYLAWHRQIVFAAATFSDLERT